jgi:hypothetical protein
MWIEEMEAKETWIDGKEVVIKKFGREYSHRLANEPGDWIQGLPDGMVWTDAQAIFEDSL